MAQRAFRQRQINAIRELKGKNQELADVIEKITQTAARFNRIDSPSARDRASLDTAIQEARSLAGLPPLGPGDGDGTHIQGGNLWLSPSRNAPETNDALIPPTTGVDDSNHVSSRGSSPSMTVSFDNMMFARDSRNRSAQNEANNQLLASRQYNSNTDSYFNQQETAPTTTVTATGGRLSPRLTYGVWFEPDRFIRIINPPGDIVPYLGANINTLSGAIFWAGLGYGFTVLKEVLRMRANSNLVRSMSMSQHPGGGSSSGSLPLVTRLFGHSIKAAGPDADGEQILHDIIHARFTWRKQGYIPGDHPGADPEITNKLFTKIVENMTAVRFPTPTSKISIRENMTNNSSGNNNRNSRRKSPDVITNQDVEDLYEATASTSGNKHLKIAITETANESTLSDSDLSNWLTPSEIEAYVKARLNASVPTTSPETSTFGGPPTSTSNATGPPSGEGSLNYSSFESAFQSRTHTTAHQRNAFDSHRTNTNERIRASMLKRLVRTLSDKGACFGNSPRWRIDVVSQAVDSWMAEVESAERAAPMGLFGFGFGDEGGFGGAGDTPISSGWDTSGAGFAATGTAESITAGAPQWYIPGFAFQTPQEYGYGYLTGHGLGVTNSTSAAVSGIATTVAVAPAYRGGGSSSSSWYGSDSEGAGTGIPQGMVV